MSVIVVAYKVSFFFIFVCNKEEVSVEVLKTYIQVSFQKYSLLSLMLFRHKGGRKGVLRLPDGRSFDAVNGLSRDTWQLA